MRNSRMSRESRTVTIVTCSCFYANATGLNILNLFPLLSTKSASALYALLSGLGALSRSAFASDSKCLRVIISYAIEGRF